MTSGVGWREDYHDLDSPASRLLARWRAGAGGLRESLLEMPPGHPPGSRYAYCTPDSLALDWARERATGEPLPGRAGAPVAGARGGAGRPWSGWTSRAASPWPAARWPPPRATGRASARCRSTAGGRDRQVVSRAWVQASSRPEREFLAPGRLPSTITTHVGFGVSLVAAGPGRRARHGRRDAQQLRVTSTGRTAALSSSRRSAWPYEDAWWDRQCRDLCYLALPAIADAAAAG